MGMDQSNFNRYLDAYNCFKAIYDLPLVKTEFMQDDPRAMDYCEGRDFVALVVPFGDPSGTLRNQIVVQNNLVSYTKMYSDLLGGSARQDRDFLLSAIEIVKKKANLSHLEEFTPIALIENHFTYITKKHPHYGVVFMARIPKGKDLGRDVVSKPINDRVYFANPHNQKLFELAKEYVEKYKTNKSLQAEIDYARKTKIKDTKSKKKKFLEDNKIDLTDYYNFKKDIVADIKMASPKSIIDIACGDDEIIYDFLNLNDNVKVYANDIALAYLENFHYYRKGHDKIQFSNLNAVYLPFKERSIDIIFCKNLLHHLNKDERKKLISNCLRICNTMVVVEILCYNEQNNDGKLLHDKFYCEILKETKNKEYLSSAQIDDLFRDSKINIQKEKTVETRNGKYKYLWVSTKDA